MNDRVVGAADYGYFEAREESRAKALRRFLYAVLAGTDASGTEDRAPDAPGERRILAAADRFERLEPVDRMDPASALTG